MYMLAMGAAAQETKLEAGAHMVQVTSRPPSQPTYQPACLPVCLVL
jgi:hypothetical protein